MNGPRIELINEKKLFGKRLRMSFSENKTQGLWQMFMPRYKAMSNKVNGLLYSVEVYDSPSFFTHFNPEAPFDKWAAAEMNEQERVPDEMESLLIPEGLYAVFVHKGPASDGQKTYSYIFQTWLPQSGYTIDNRPHFALMGEKYKHNEADSEEEIWIPILKQQNDS